MNFLLPVLLSVVSSSSLSPLLNCDFSLPCCWSSPPDRPWTTRHSIGINDYMRTFMVGRGRPPPKGNFVVRSQREGVSPLESCPFCTRTGVIHLQYRHWQSRGASFSVCWRLAGEEREEEKCQSVGPSRQSQLLSHQIIVPHDRDVQLSFLLSSRSNDSEAIAMVDTIRVRTNLCEKGPAPPPRATTTCIVSGCPTMQPPARNQSPSQRFPLPFHGPPGGTRRVEEEKETTTRPPLPPSSTPMALPPSPDNPLNDLLGEEFVKFLDPSYESEPEDYDGEVVPSPPPVPPPSPPPSPRPRVPSVLSMDECPTAGGCLFERGLCGYSQPPSATGQSPFKITHVGSSRFAKADVPANTVSVLEAEARMERNHVMLFDALLFTASSRLGACCVHPSKPLSCVYTLPTLMPLWQTGRLDCGQGTTKLMFICENYSEGSAVCGLDNIRLHLASDIFFLEPCQKRLLSHL